MSILDFIRPKWKNSSEKVRLEAIDTLQDLKIINKIALTDPSYTVRSKAVEKVTDQATLAEIAQHDRSLSVREKAISLLRYEKVLTKIALTAKNPTLRSAATRKLSDAVVLMKILRKEQDGNIRGLIIAKISDQKHLAYIAMNDPYEESRRMAVYKLTDQDALAELAINGPSEITQREAVNQITDAGVLDYIAQNSSIGSTKQAVDVQLKRLEYSNSCALCGKTLLSRQEMLEMCHQNGIMIAWAAKPQMEIGMKNVTGWRDIYRELGIESPEKAALLNSFYKDWGRQECTSCASIWCNRCIDGGLERAFGDNATPCSCHESVSKQLEEFAKTDDDFALDDDEEEYEE
ncbi:MAG: hypothetical protein L3J71_00420 [Victivallaceae bacterium]|nr:hypothetical protein [Victivallaceae bacterium]